jgi:hypothetical protein
MDASLEARDDVAVVVDGLVANCNLVLERANQALLYTIAVLGDLELFAKFLLGVCVELGAFGLMEVGCACQCYSLFQIEKCSPLAADETVSNMLPGSSLLLCFGSASLRVIGVAMWMAREFPSIQTLDRQSRSQMSKNTLKMVMRLHSNGDLYVYTQT